MISKTKQNSKWPQDADEWVMASYGVFFFFCSIPMVALLFKGLIEAVEFIKWLWVVL